MDAIYRMPAYFHSPKWNYILNIVTNVSLFSNLPAVHLYIFLRHLLWWSFVSMPAWLLTRDFASYVQGASSDFVIEPYYQLGRLLARYLWRPWTSASLLFSWKAFFSSKDTRCTWAEALLCKTIGLFVHKGRSSTYFAFTFGTVTYYWTATVFKV